MIFLFCLYRNIFSNRLNTSRIYMLVIVSQTVLVSIRGLMSTRTRPLFWNLKIQLEVISTTGTRDIFVLWDTPVPLETWSLCNCWPRLNILRWFERIEDKRRRESPCDLFCFPLILNLQLNTSPLLLIVIYWYYFLRFSLLVENRKQDKSLSDLFFELFMWLPRI